MPIDFMETHSRSIGFWSIVGLRTWLLGFAQEQVDQWRIPMLSMADIDQAVATMFIAMIIGIVIAGAVMAYLTRKR
jgi:hypothetical protein